MVNLVPTSGGVVANADSWHDYVYYSSGQLWNAVSDASSYAGAISSI